MSHDNSPRAFIKDTTKSARTSKSDMSEFENPRSIIPTKGEKVELEKLEGFDLKYTSGRRFCGMYTPTMSTAFDPKSAEDLYQARMRKILSINFLLATRKIDQDSVCYSLILAATRTESSRDGSDNRECSRI